MAPNRPTSALGMRSEPLESSLPQTLACLQELSLPTCPSRVVVMAAKACPLRAVAIPVDPPCTAQELAEIIQAKPSEANV